MVSMQSGSCVDISDKKMLFNFVFFIQLSGLKSFYPYFSKVRQPCFKKMFEIGKKSIKGFKKITRE